jgi:DNA-binding response OmpR family regulator
MKKILVIEDEQDVRESILDILNAENFYALSAEDGRVGVNLAAEFQPNLIICDVMMPELDGYGVLTHLRQNPVTEIIPLIFLTAKSDKTDFRQGMDLGADDYLTKPFTHGELLQAIATRLGKQETVKHRAQQKLDDLSHSISLALPHELNTVLNVIGGLSSLLMEDCNSLTRSDIYEMAEAIQLNSKRMQRLVQNFLLLAQLEVLATNPDKMRALRNNQTTDAIDVISEVAYQKAIQYCREPDLKVDLGAISAQISPPKLKKIAEELIDNAFKFSLEGSPVQVYSSQHDNTFILHISDYGRGMTTEQIADIGACIQFDRDFYEQQGMGLGLTIAKRLIALHGGELILESIPGKQTIARVSLPG